MTVLMVSFLFIYLVVLPSSQLNSKRDIGNHLVRQQMEKNVGVGGIEIGPEWCEVNVQVPIKKR
ncbi:hypothetical protein HanXRQr2_Chr11g0503991 [Helianthus annuus]|uniref:Uncharacterized protein n=1 Tax=Helianthus annuus TaxID=4232 RepID=A0A251TCT6_HELAN|nr:hypothetical protein HanXRQr2_Chr11g0503991 [Helianthus annuus]KAJ0502507.1 hypothetical protein HanHA300_Chr11g0413711 [Helianthus annuus]KAJ0518448.1 hypothetical protein HanHA89_Chr11g0437581 [Helianthus annuus]KAJ0686482.1 hypothetical protein HanLR1_Chr11g0415261 [Helianthus annuus]KAJ0876196.1 hypothetical protein HanPSC8_Chr11g0485641 [Helianthus annuus]